MLVVDPPHPGLMGTLEIRRFAGNHLVHIWVIELPHEACAGFTNDRDNNCTSTIESQQSWKK